MAKRKSKKSKGKSRHRKSPKRVAAGKKAARTRKRRAAERRAARHGHKGKRRSSGRRRSAPKRRKGGRRSTHGVKGLQRKLKSLRHKATKTVRDIQHKTKMEIEAARLRATIKRDRSIARAARASALETSRAAKREARMML